MSCFLIFFLDFLQIASGVNPNFPLGAGYIPSSSANDKQSKDAQGSNFLDSSSNEMKIDKSNILLLGPTGSGR